jgi:hypothetical protein
MTTICLSTYCGSRHSSTKLRTSSLLISVMYSGENVWIDCRCGLSGRLVVSGEGRMEALQAPSPRLDASVVGVLGIFSVKRQSPLRH